MLNFGSVTFHWSAIFAHLVGAWWQAIYCMWFVYESQHQTGQGLNNGNVFLLQRGWSGDIMRSHPTWLQRHTIIYSMMALSHIDSIMIVLRYHPLSKIMSNFQVLSGQWMPLTHQHYLVFRIPQELRAPRCQISFPQLHQPVWCVAPTRRLRCSRGDFPSNEVSDMCWAHVVLGGGNSKIFFIFTPIMGKIPNLTKIFFNWVEITKQCWILDVFLPNYCFHVLGKKQVFILWGKVLVLLLMEEILHHLGCIKPWKQWYIYHINWFVHQQYHSIMFF